mmetsp:Transcript_7983/g.25518  ORF Transcript_7983/g.25518 Transcript_7983/m.25518 type:complete len:264 (+) Transcript_7983:905-1696(+)
MVTPRCMFMTRKESLMAPTSGRGSSISGGHVPSATFTWANTSCLDGAASHVTTAAIKASTANTRKAHLSARPAWTKATRMKTMAAVSCADALPRPSTVAWYAGTCQMNPNTAIELRKPAVSVSGRARYKSTERRGDQSDADMSTIPTTTPSAPTTPALRAPILSYSHPINKYSPIETPDAIVYTCDSLFMALARLPRLEKAPASASSGCRVGKPDRVPEASTQPTSTVKMRSERRKEKLGFPCATRGEDSLIGGEQAKVGTSD